MPTTCSAAGSNGVAISCSERLPKQLVMLFLAALLAVQLTGCGGSPRLDQGEETVLLSVEQIAGPKGKLLYRGKEYTDQVEVSANALVGVSAYNEIYLYHPALGDEAPSMYNSRRAVGYFIDGLAKDTESKARFYEQALPVLNRLALSARSCRGEPIPIQENVNLLCGAKVYAYEQDRCKVTNMTKRWMAVKTSSGDGPYLLPPRSDSALETDLISLYNQFSQGWLSEYPSKDVNGSTVEMFAAIFRATSAIWDGEDPETLLQILPEWMRRVILSDPEMRPPLSPEEIQLELALLKAKAAEALAHDRELFQRINTLDLAHFILEGLKSILGVLPSECIEAVLSALFINVGETAMIGLLTFEPDQAIAFSEKAAKELASSVALCGVEFVPGANIASLIVSNFLDIVSALGWVTDWKKAQDDVFEYTAYDCVTFTQQSFNRGTITFRHLACWYEDTDGDTVTYDDDSFSWDSSSPDSPVDVLTTFSDNEFEAWWTGVFQVAYYTEGHMKITIDPQTDTASFTATSTISDDEDGGRPTTTRITGSKIPRVHDSGIEDALMFQLSGTQVCTQIGQLKYEYRNNEFDLDYANDLVHHECTPESTITIILRWQ
jgi:hypothetical protein